MKSMLRLCLPLCCAAACLARAAPAGTVIQNQASAQFSLPGGGAGLVNSEPAQLLVNAVCRVQVTPDGTPQAPGQRLTVRAGEPATLRYELSNAGNGPATFTLSAQALDGAFFPNLTTFVDANGDGQPQPGEQAEQLTLGAGASAAVLLVAVVPAGASGAALVNLTAQCPGGAQDDNNVAQLVATPPPHLELHKAFGAERLRPGDQTGVTVTATNTGAGAAPDVVLEDPLGQQLDAGLTYVPGSARTDRGRLEYSADGASWQAAEPAAVRGVRVQAGTLEPGEQTTLTFRMEARPSAENHLLNNVATVRSATGEGAQASDTLDVRFQPGVALGPLGQPLAPEGTAADGQTLVFAVTGEPACFDHTVQNTGDVTDVFRLSVSVTQGQATPQLLGAAGEPLPQPFTLAPGEQRQVRVCYDLQGAQPLTAQVTVQGERGTSNATADLIRRVETQRPGLRKTVSKVGAPDWAPGSAVTSGDELEYTLSVTNPFAQPLVGVQVLDPLPAGTEFVSASDGGALLGAGGAAQVAWTLGDLPAGASRTLTLRVRVGRDVRDDQELRNVFELTSSELPAPLHSNAASAVVWNTAPLLSKTLDRRDAAPGDLLTYTLTLKNPSASTALVDLVITDTPAAALKYVTGTSRLAGVPTADPAENGGELQWRVPRLGAGESLTLSYGLRVLPGAAGELLNSATLRGYGEQTHAVAVASNRAQVSATLKLLNFAPLGDVLGTVYLDANGNRRLDEGETVLSGARVALAGGRLALTDSRGRYHFGNVDLGTQALRLDLGSVPAVRDPGTQVVQVQGLTTVDFPLRALAALQVKRDLRVQVGELTLTKRLTEIPGGYRVTTALQSPVALAEVAWTDPLPAGAALVSGQNVRRERLSAGSTTWTYDLRWSGPPSAALTDPVLKVVK